MPASVAFRWRFWKLQTGAEASWMLKGSRKIQGRQRKISGIPGILWGPPTNLCNNLNNKIGQNRHLKTNASYKHGGGRRARYKARSDRGGESRQEPQCTSVHVSVYVCMMCLTAMHAKGWHDACQGMVQWTGMHLCEGSGEADQ